MESWWAEIAIDLYDESEGKVYLCGWETEDEDEDGEIIVKIDYKTKEVEYLDEIAKTDHYAQKVIGEVFKKIDNGDYKNYK